MSASECFRAPYDHPTSGFFALSGATRAWRGENTRGDYLTWPARASRTGRRGQAVTQGDLDRVTVHRLFFAAHRPCAIFRLFSTWAPSD